MRFNSVLHGSIGECKFKVDPVVIWVNAFDEEAAKHFSASMSQAHDCDQPVIPVVVDSYGGVIDGLLSMISDIETAEKPVATIVQGKAMSAGAVLLAAGTSGYRFMGPNARIMVHGVAAETSWQKVEDLVTHADEFKRMNAYVYELMAGKCGREPSFFLDEMKSRGNVDWYMTPPDAKAVGIIDHIRIPKMSRIVDVSYRFA